MTLYVVGIGLYDEKDITLRGLEYVKKCKKVYLETYTSKLQTSLEKLEELYGKKVILVPRDFVERKVKDLLQEAQKGNIALLIIGSPLAATTHIELLLQAKKYKTKIKFVENASVLTAVGITGLSLYKFGRVTTIPFDNKNITTPIDILKLNQKHKLHTLFLLDIQGDNLMTIKDALNYLLNHCINPGVFCVGCGGLGSPNQEIKAGKINELLNYPFEQFPQCLIIPGKLNFKEEEALQLYL